MRPAPRHFTRHPATIATGGCMHHKLNDSLLDRSMNMSPFRATFAVIFALTMLSLASPSSAQQNAAPLQQSPALSQSAPVPAPSAAVPSAPTPAADATATATPADGSRSLKSTTVALRELSP